MNNKRKMSDEQEAQYIADMQKVIDNQREVYMYDPTETEGASEEPSCPLTTEKEEESSEECTDNSCSSGQCG